MHNIIRTFTTQSNLFDINMNFLTRDNYALDALITFLQNDGTQMHLLEMLKASALRHGGPACKCNQIIMNSSLILELFF